MTEEEKKAEERCKKEFCTQCLQFGKCEQSIAFCTKGTNYCKSIVIELLEKAIEELKETLELKKMVLKFRRHQNRRLRDKLKRMEAQDAEWHAAVESENARLKVQLNEALARIQKLEKGQ